MGFGAFSLFDAVKGGNDRQSDDPNSPFYAGGSSNKAYKEVAGNARALFKQVNRAPIVGPDASGFMPYQREGMNVFARNLFSANSARNAAGGGYAPQNFDAVVGSSLTQALPNLFAIQNQNQFLPSEVAQSRMGIFNPMIQAGQTSLGPGVGYNNLNQANAHYWNMMDNIGSSWGSMGKAGGGQSAVGNSGIGSGIRGVKGFF